MSAFSEYQRDLFEKYAKEIQIGMVCKLQNFDKQKMRADAVPLLKSRNALGDEVDFPVLSKIPVQFLYAGGFFIRPDYQNGDMVWVSFATHDIQSAIQGVKQAASERIFGLENACITHAIAPSNANLPDKFSQEGLIIGHKDGDCLMQILKKSIKVILEAKEILLDKDGVTIKDAGDVKFQPSGRSAKTDGFMTAFGPTVSRLPGIHP